MDLQPPFKLMLGSAHIEETIPNLFVKKLDPNVSYNNKDFFENILAEKPFTMPGITLNKRFLVVEILPATDYHQKLEHEFSFKEFEVLTMIDGEPQHQPITLAQVRELIHELSVSYNGKTFEERDFQNAVFLQTSVARNDNRNQDECYNDASSIILYLFVYGFLHNILTLMNGKIPEKGALISQKSVPEVEVCQEGK